MRDCASPRLGRENRTEEQVARIGRCWRVGIVDSDSLPTSRRKRFPSYASRVPRRSPGRAAWGCSFVAGSGDRSSRHGPVGDRPGMEVFSRYAKVLEADGTQMRVRTALSLINEALEEVLSAEETEFDVDTRWALTWYQQFGHDTGPFGMPRLYPRQRTLWWTGGAGRDR